MGSDVSFTYCVCNFSNELWVQINLSAAFVNHKMGIIIIPSYKIVGERKRDDSCNLGTWHRAAVR